MVAASEKAELERIAAEWRDAHPAATVAVLRPTVTVSAEANGWLARALARSTSLPIGDEEPPAQFLDVDDLAAAVDLARRGRLDGPRNVAPDGWISGDTVRSLAGGPPRIRLPERVALQLAGFRWRWRLAPTPPSLLPLTVHPWVIANDRLKADGWEPASSNEEAYVGAHRAGPWATLSPRRRQELALGAAGAVLVGGRRRSRSPPCAAVERRSLRDADRWSPRPRGGVRRASSRRSPPRRACGARSTTTRSELDRIGSPPSSVMTSPPTRPAAVGGAAGHHAADLRTASDADHVGLRLAEVRALDPQPAMADLAVGEQLVGQATHELDRGGEAEARPVAAEVGGDPDHRARGVDQRTA